MNNQQKALITLVLYNVLCGIALTSFIFIIVGVLPSIAHTLTTWGWIFYGFALTIIIFTFFVCLAIDYEVYEQKGIDIMIQKENPEK